MRSGALLLPYLLVAACGGRSYEVLLDADQDDGTAAGTGAGGSPTSGAGTGTTSAGGSGTGEGGAGTTGTTGTTGVGGGDGGEGGALPDPPPSPIDCVSCIGRSCPEVVDCLQDPACTQGMVCTFTSCLGGGLPDLMCVTDCFDGDFGAALQALQVFGCVFQSCADECGGLFPGPGGGGGP